MSKDTSAFNPLAVRAHFILRGTSCRRWATDKGFKFRHVHQIIHGIKGTSGPAGARISKALKRELRKAG